MWIDQVNSGQLALKLDIFAEVERTAAVMRERNLGAKKRNQKR